jgi:hypothetical protein
MTKKAFAKGQADRPICVIIWGMGATGIIALRTILGSVKNIRVVGAVDWDPILTGKDLGDLVPEARGLGVTIAPSLEACLEGLSEPADVVYHLTESDPKVIQPQLELALSRKLNVLSGAEPMFHLWLGSPAIAASLDRVAKANGVSIAGCGVNPGFVLDTLIVALAYVSTAITRVEVSRVARIPMGGPGDLKHVGTGLWPEEFKQKLAAGEITGHYGMYESMVAVAERVGLPIDRIEQTWVPITRPYPVEESPRAISADWPMGTLEPGRVVDITQDAVAYVGDREAIKIHLDMFHHPERHGLEPADEITIEGSPVQVHAILKPGLLAGSQTGAVLVNTTDGIVKAAPGLQSMFDFSLGGGYRGGFRLAMDPARPPVPGKMWLVQVPAAHA